MEIFLLLFCRSGFIILFHKSNFMAISCSKIVWDSICSGSTQKINLRQFFCSVRDYKTHISMELGHTRDLYLKMFRGQSCKSQLFKGTNKENPPQMFSLACNLLKMDARSNDFEALFIVKNPSGCNQMTSNQVGTNINALNHFHF